MDENVWITRRLKCPDSNTLTYKAEYTRWGNSRGIARSQAVGLAVSDVLSTLNQGADQSNCPEDCEKKIDGPHGGLTSVKYFQSWRSLWFGVYCTAKVSGKVTVNCTKG